MGARSLGPIRSRKSGLSPSLSVLCGRPVKQALCSLVPSVGVRDGDADDDDDARARVRLPAVHASLHCFAELTGLAPSLTAQAGRQARQAHSAAVCFYSVFLSAAVQPSSAILPISSSQFPTHDASVRKDAALTQLGLAFSQNLFMSNKIKNTDLQTNSPTIYRLRLG